MASRPSRTKVDIWNLACDLIGEAADIESEADATPKAAVCRRHWDNVLQRCLEYGDWPWSITERTLTELGTQATSYSGDDSTTAFDVPYAFNEATQLVVTLDGTTQTNGTDYTLTQRSASQPTAYITMTTAPATGETLTVTVTTSRSGWDYVYTLPSNFVKPIGLLPTGISWARYEAMREERRAAFTIVVNDSEDGWLLCTNAEEDDFKFLYVYLPTTHFGHLPRHFVDAVAAGLAVPLALAIRKDRELAKEMRELNKKLLDEAMARALNAENVGTYSHRPPSPSLVESASYSDHDAWLVDT